MTNKYEMLKKYVNELSEVKGNDGTLKDIKDLMNDLDKTDSKENTNLISQSEWNALGYKERIDFKESDPETFNNAMAEKYKEVK